MNDDAIKYGILKCRDLVQLYYGARMVVSIIENNILASAGSSSDLFALDPRRIRYEIVVMNGSGGDATFTVGTPAADQAGTDEQYAIGAGQNVVIDRNFITDFDAVTLPQTLFASGGNLSVSTRETFLTPAPVDEIP